ncbi:hypothetical protein FGO68_gene7837 [Halteria grandinella]|uniref:EF-hand domain-containing protein n=1 Tax=Halteria grandinella TaxID=5974 RepID=A0A8J8SYQ2_HALGN|nr:hypothetical protein FGO68_gene7837 [Halteria grandinella]
MQSSSQRDHYIPGLTQEELQELQALFRIIDVDNKGLISRRDFSTALKMLGTSNHTLLTSERHQTSKPDSNISFREFAEYVRDNTMLTDFSQGITDNTESTLSELKMAFKVFDVDGKGYIDVDSLKKVAKHVIKEEVPDEVLEMMIQAGDKDCDGVVKYEEFLALFRDNA